MELRLRLLGYKLGPKLRGILAGRLLKDRHGVLLVAKGKIDLHTLAGNLYWDMKLFPFVATIVLIVGCSSPPRQSANIWVNGKSKVFLDNDKQIFQGNGYSFSFPKDWVPLNLTKRNLRVVQKRLSVNKDFAHLSRALENPEVAQALKFCATIPKLSTKSFKAVMNVVELESPAPITPDQFFKTNIDLVRETSNIPTSTEDLPGNIPGKLIRSGRKANGINGVKGTQTFHIAQLYLRGNFQVSITYAYAAESDATAKDELDPVIKSFHWN